MCCSLFIKDIIMVSVTPDYSKEIRGLFCVFVFIVSLAKRDNSKLSAILYCHSLQTSLEIARVLIHLCSSRQYPWRVHLAILK